MQLVCRCLPEEISRSIHFATGVRDNRSERRKFEQLPQIVPENRADLEKILSEYIGSMQFAHQFASCIDELRRKNADYSGKADPIANFRQLSAELGLPMRQIWLVYFQKGLDAIRRYAKDGVVASEGIHSRIDDAIAYLVLLNSIVIDQENL